MTTAEQIAQRFNNDGQCFESSGSYIMLDCDDLASYVYCGGDREMYLFEDGSGIFIAENAWDIVSSPDGGDTWVSDGWGTVATIDAYGNIDWTGKE